MAQAVKKNTPKMYLVEKKKPDYHKQLRKIKREGGTITVQVGWVTPKGGYKKRWGTIKKYAVQNKILTLDAGLHYGPYDISVDSINFLEVYSEAQVIRHFINSSNLDPKFSKLSK